MEKDEKKDTKNREYSRNYYNLHKEKFKKYYETYKKNKLEKLNGTFVPPVKIKKSKRELEALKWERKNRKLEERKKWFIEELKKTGFII